MSTKAEEEDEIERMQVEAVFHLNNEELAHSDWKYHYDRGEGEIRHNQFHFWYEGAPEYVRKELEQKYGYDAEMRTVISDGTFPGRIDDSRTEEWVRVADFQSSGEVQCPLAGDDQEEDEDTKTFKACPLCEEDEEHGYIYLGDGWAEVVYVRDAIMPAYEALASWFVVAIRQDRPFSEEDFDSAEQTIEELGDQVPPRVKNTVEAALGRMVDANETFIKRHNKHPDALHLRAKTLLLEALQRYVNALHDMVTDTWDERADPAALTDWPAEVEEAIEETKQQQKALQTQGRRTIAEQPGRRFALLETEDLPARDTGESLTESDLRGRKLELNPKLRRNPRPLGGPDLKRLATSLVSRFGRQALVVFQDSQRGVIVPDVMVPPDLSETSRRYVVSKINESLARR